MVELAEYPTLHPLHECPFFDAARGNYVRVTSVAHGTVLNESKGFACSFTVERLPSHYITALPAAQSPSVTGFTDANMKPTCKLLFAVDGAIILWSALYDNSPAPQMSVLHLFAASDLHHIDSWTLQPRVLNVFWWRPAAGVDKANSQTLCLAEQRNASFFFSLNMFRYAAGALVYERKIDFRVPREFPVVVDCVQGRAEGELYFSVGDWDEDEIADDYHTIFSVRLPPDAFVGVQGATTDGERAAAPPSRELGALIAECTELDVRVRRKGASFIPRQHSFDRDLWGMVVRPANNLDALPILSVRSGDSLLAYELAQWTLPSACIRPLVIPGMLRNTTIDGVEGYIEDICIGCIPDAPGLAVIRWTAVSVNPGADTALTRFGDAHLPLYRFPWTTRVHQRLPRSLRRTVRTALLLRVRGSNRREFDAGALSIEGELGSAGVLAWAQLPYEVFEVVVDMLLQALFIRQGVPTREGLLGARSVGGYVLFPHADEPAPAPSFCTVA